MTREKNSNRIFTNPDRRSFLIGASALIGGSLLNPKRTWALDYKPRFAADPFSLGIASGDPWPESVVLWTRLAPDPVNGGGMTPQPVTVKWEVAADDKMKKIVQQGTATAAADWAHSVHAEVNGLQPGRNYWYRFIVGSDASPIGRTRTAPALDSKPDQFKFGFVSCQHYEQGFYTAYRNMAKDDLDLVVHLGDYIYEGGVAQNNDRPRKHNSPEIMALPDYRNRYALYKSDPDLKATHAAFPWILTWDDHEVENNYANDINEHNTSPEEFLIRQAQAYQAYYEHMPLRSACMPRGIYMHLYRRFQFGNLAEFNVLDTRQYRTDQPCGDGSKIDCTDALDPRNTIMGPEQERWLFSGLDFSKAKWNVIAQQVMIAPIDSEPGPKQKFSMDQWSGYAASRSRLMKFLQRRKPANPVVISGDIHSNWVADLHPEFYDEKSPAAGTEFVGTSITSGGNGSDTRPTTAGILSENPHIKFFNNQRGYVRCTLTQQRWQSDYRVMSGVTTQDGTMSTRASFVVENGKTGVKKA